MSSVVIAGDVAGSITLQAPSSAGSAVLTLPATTATLLTDSSGVLNIGSGQIYKDASGNVGIGVTPSTILHVKSATPIFRLETTGTVTTGGAAYNTIVDSTSSAVWVNGFAGLANCYQFTTNFTNGFMRFMTGVQVEAMRIDPSGNVTLQKNISVGAAAPTTSGTGITFPATQSASSNANTLDDYEEGTWTPVPSAGITFAGTASYTANYTKIGRLVTANISISGQPTVHQWDSITLPFPIFGSTAGIANCLGGDIGNGSVVWAAWSSNLLVFSATKIIDGNGLHMCVIYNTTT